MNEKKDVLVSSAGNISSELFTLPRGFDDTCMDVFRYQSKHNPVYRSFLLGLHVDPLIINTIECIPFLPVELFKTHTIIVEGMKTQAVFTSSATGGGLQSRHPVGDLFLYQESFRRAFRQFYGDIREYAILALLPSYLEREGSSLIYMVQDLIRTSAHPSSGFYLHNHDDLHANLLKLEAAGQKTILLGVSYGLLDFAEKYQMHLKHTLVMETGGMKGKRREMVKEEMHEYLCSRLGVKSIHSEYGMTELLSQAYSSGGGVFRCPPWMRVMTRETTDPLTLTVPGRSGGINVIDLGNLYSCSFISTQDLGKVYPDHSFEVLGRFDNSDQRGCNLMIE